MRRLGLVEEKGISIYEASLSLEFVVEIRQIVALAIAYVVFP